MNITLFTPLLLEQQAVLPFIQNRTERLWDGHLYVEGSFQGKYQKFHITLIVTGSNNSLISNVVERSLALFKPNLAILLGIAGGVKDVAIGDVVVGTKSYGYESGKEKESGFVVRPQVFPASQDLISLAQLVHHQNQWQKKINATHSSPKVVFGPIASGDKVVATIGSPIYQLLKQAYNDTTALEMEAFGFGQALHQHQNVRWLNVRSISDLLEGKNATDDTNHQPLAAATAAAFVFEMLYQFDASQFNLPIMTTKELAQSIYNILFTPDRLQPGQNIEATLEQIKNSSVQTLWKKVQPLLGEAWEDLQEDPEDEDAQAATRSKLKRALNKNETLKLELEKLTQQALKAENKEASVMVSNSKNVITGSTISAGRDFHLGDVNTTTTTNIGQQVNNSGTVHEQYNIPNNRGTIQIADTIHIHQVLAESPPVISSKKRQNGIETIHQLIGANKIKSALEELLRLSKTADSEVQHQAIILTSRWNRIRQEKFAGTMTNEQVNIQQNRVLGGILGVLEQLV